MKRFLFTLSVRLLLLGIGFSLLLAVACAYYIQFEIADIQALNTIQLQVPLQIYSQDEKLIATFGEKRRIPVPYNEIPKPLIYAVLATEDQRYFKHAGVDIPGLARAALRLLLTGKKSEGGSTITMQIARSFYLTRHKTFSRKIREILFAIKIEHTLSKEKILELYLNKVFLGNRAYGFGAAAEIYYGKPLSELTLDQYATLAGLPKAPSSLNPLANPSGAKKRRDHVLSRMLEQGYITEAQYQKAIRAPINARYHNLPTALRAPYAAEVAREQLEQMYGDSIYTDGFKAYTTINSHMQIAANEAITDQVIAYDKRHGYRGSKRNLGMPSITNLESWQKKLDEIPVINGLENAAVMDISAKSITVVRANGEMAVIGWEGLAWARKQINPDYLGQKPALAKHIVRLGDVVQIHQLKNGRFALAQIPKVEAGLVAMRASDGAIQALVGGFDFELSKFNTITRAQRQPGSSFKPFIYAAALDKGYTLATVINDAPIVIENKSTHTIWRPENHTHQFYGATRLREAMVTSSNVVSIRLLALIGLPYTLDYLKRFGFNASQLPNGLSLALGTALVTPLQMAQAFSVFANGGFRTTPYLIDSIRNTHDEVIYQAKPLMACPANCDPGISPAPRVLSPQNAFLMTSVLQDVFTKVNSSTPATLKLHRHDLAGKTGTTQDYKDAWFAGYNREMTAVAWMGFNQPQSLHEYGAQAALPIWSQFIEKVLKGKPDYPLAIPKEIIKLPINPQTGKRTFPNDPNSVVEFFAQDHTPQEEYAPELDIYGDARKEKDDKIYL